MPRARALERNRAGSWLLPFRSGRFLAASCEMPPRRPGRAGAKRDARDARRRERQADVAERGRQRPIEAALVPEVGFGAAEAAVARLDRERNAAIPFQCRAGIVSDRPFAADLVEAIAAPRAVVVETLGEFAPLIERAAVAAIMDRLAVERLRTSEVVEFRQLAERNHVGDRAGHRFGDGRAAGNVDHRFADDEP